jgi:hypothetical protein
MKKRVCHDDNPCTFDTCRKNLDVVILLLFVMTITLVLRIGVTLLKDVFMKNIIRIGVMIGMIALKTIVPLNSYL